MAVNFNKTIKTLQMGINSKGHRLLYNRKQWYSDKQQRPINIYTVSREVWNEDRGKYDNVQLFSTYSQVQLVKYLRDYWYAINDMPIPDEEEDTQWKEIKEKEGITFDDIRGTANE